MKIYYIANHLDGCYYARCLVPMIANGWRGDLMSIGGTRRPMSESVRESLAADVVVFQRPDEFVRLEAAKMLKESGKLLVFENDDTYKVDDCMKFGEVFKSKNQALDEFIKISDLVTTTTEYLANEYRQLNDNVVVLPNVIDEDDWDEPERNDGDKVRVGIVGSVASNGDSDGIEEALRMLNKRGDVQLVLFGLPRKSENTRKVCKIYEKEFEFWEKFDYEWQPFVEMEDYFDTLNELRLDIMLAPRKEIYFNKCKSNIKYLESSMLEIPMIAQGFSDGNSPYDFDLGKKNNPNGDLGVLIKDDNDWYKEIIRLVENKGLRRRIGKNAKEYVLKNYNIKDKGHLWVDAYKKLYEAKK